VVLADNPVGYWRFGELSGTTATARAGTPNGTYTNGPILGVGGGVGDTDSGALFDGVDDRVRFGDVHHFPSNAPFSIECGSARPP
jgi:hypothetical protein